MNLNLSQILLVVLIPITSVLAKTVNDHDKMVGCYWGTWAFYRPGYGKFDVKNIDASLCTHGYYGFADINNRTEDPHVWEVVAYDPWFDQAPDDCTDWANNCDPDGDGGRCCHFDSFRRFVAIKETHPNFKAIISIGGWNAYSEKFSQVAADPEKRQIFLDSLIPFVKKYGFDGVDFDWEYPGARDSIDPEHDKDNFSVLVEMMGELLHSHGLSFSAAMSPGKNTIDKAYDVPRISKVFDWMNIMTYDYHGWWENNSHPFTGHNAPLYGRDEEKFPDHPGWYFSVWDTMNYYIELGAPIEKMVMGMAQYGRGMTLEDPEVNGLYCPAKDGIPAGPYTQQDGIWGFLEIQQAFHNKTLINLPGATPGMENWHVVVDDCYHSPYAYNGPYWISYDDEDSIRIKAQYVNFLNVMGGFTWSIETDDFEARYFPETYPLLRAINDEFAKGAIFDPENPKCTGTAPMCDIRPTTTTPTPDTTTKPSDNDCKEDLEVLPMPGDCHKYYMCIATDDNGHFDILEMDCKEYVFNPNIDACVDPNLPGNENICEHWTTTLMPVI